MCSQCLGLVFKCAHQSISAPVLVLHVSSLPLAHAAHSSSAAFVRHVRAISPGKCAAAARLHHRPIKGRQSKRE